MSRGTRNNNPGNIRWGDDWRGLVPLDKRTDRDFCQFIAPVYGIRAMFKILRGAYERRGLDTIQEIIPAWAPPIENNVAAYISSVTQSSGVGPDVDLTNAPADVWIGVVKAIIRHENGVQPYSDNTILDAFKLAS
jgi:hypothetical protein